MTRVLAKYVTVGGVTYPPGPVSDEVAAQITATSVWADDAAAADADSGDDSGGSGSEAGSSEGESAYADWAYPDLKAEVKARNEGRDEDTQIVPVSRRGADLVAALEADDAAAADADSGDDSGDQ